MTPPRFSPSPMTTSPPLSDRSSHTAPSTSHHHSPLPHLPPAAFHKPNRHPARRNPPVLYVPSPRQHGSVSSDGTTASSNSTSKINHPQTTTSPYYMSPHAEQGYGSPITSGLMNKLTQANTPQSMSDGERRTRDDNSAVFRYIQEQEQQEQEDEHAIAVVAFLSTLDPLYSAFSAIYSTLIGIIFLLASPLCLCDKSFSAGRSVVRLLAPVLRKHLKLIHATSINELHNLDFSPTKLILVHAISPVLSIGVAISAWIAACFWLFALMMGNPDGTERSDDGRVTVLNLRDWWEKFLLSSAKST